MLTYALEKNGSSSLYTQLYGCIRRDILSGALPPRQKLPSKRALAQHLEVSVITVKNAYEQLAAEGYIYTVEKKGYYVSPVERPLPLADPPPLTPEKPAEPVFLDLATGSLDRSYFPFTVWSRLMRQTILEEDTELLRAAPSNGAPALRRTIAAHLRQFRGMDVDPEQIIIGAGTELLYTLIIQLLGREKRYAVEDPGYGKIARIYQAHQVPLCRVGLDGGGLDVTQLRRQPADVVHISPSHHYPTGIVMPIARRQELLRWAEEKPGRYLIEDDYDSEFRYKGKPIPALQGSDSNGKVIYTGTFSKSLAPSIRMSYMVLPEHILKIYQEKCRFISSTVSKVDQMILQKFMEEGYYERHLNKTRALYKNRHDVLISSLRKMKEILEISGENAGVHLLLHFKTDDSEKDLIEKAAKQGVRVYGLSEYCVKDNEDSTGKAVILLGYANMNEERIRAAVQLLCKAWE